MADVPYRVRGAAQRVEKKRMMLAAIGSGMTVKQACESLNRSTTWYQKCRAEDRMWAGQCDQARQNFTGAVELGPVTSHGGRPIDLPQFRKMFFNRDTPAHHHVIIDAINRAAADSVTVILAYPESAKGLALDTLLPTPTGWTTMGEVKVGDWLLDDHGDPCQVSVTSEIHDRPCYELSFSGGQRIVADDQHIWRVRSNRCKTVQDRSTQDLHATQHNGERSCHAVPVVAPLQLPNLDLPVDPYVLGAWLGDGTTTSGVITSGYRDAEMMAGFLRDAGEIVNVYDRGRGAVALSCVHDPTRCGRGHLRTKATCTECSAQDYRKGKYAEPMSVRMNIGLTERLRNLGVLHDKHIPAVYLRASEKQRWALLQGLMDTDGTVTATRGTCCFTNMNLTLTRQVRELAVTLGLKTTITSGTARIDGRDCGTYEKVSFTALPGDPVFRLPRKSERLNNRTKMTDRGGWRVITSITEVPRVPTRCISVDSPTHMFLAGEQMIPTHNTSVISDYLCWRFAYDPNHRAAIVSEGQDLARKILGQIGNRMTDQAMFEHYIKTFGPFKADERETGKSWSADVLNMVKATHDEKEPSLEARGAGSRIYGSRYDDMILDDIQSDVSLDMTPKLVYRLRQSWLTRLAAGKGKTVIVGSHVGPGDFYEGLEDTDIVDKTIVIPALDMPIPRDEHYTTIRKRIIVNPDCPAKPTWPEHWPLDRLANRRAKVGEEVWARTYMQQTVISAQQTFSDPIIEHSLDRARGIGRNSLGTGVVIGVDPALDTGRCAFAVLAYNDHCMWLIDLVEHTTVARYEDIFGEIARLATAYRPTDVVVEINNFQKGLVEDDRMRALKDRFGFNVRSQQTGRNKTDPVLGVTIMPSAMKNGEIRIPYADDGTTRDIVEPLLAQMRSWRPLKRGTMLRQDLLLTIWFAWRVWEDDLRHSTVDFPQQWRPSFVRTG